MVALVTPMEADGSIAWEALDALIDWQIEQGTDAIVSVGTTGESATLDVSEHGEVIRRTIAQVAGRIPVIAGTGANSTREAIELTAEAANAGADAALLVCPYYNKPTQEGLYQHHKAIAEAVAIPQILYNVPGRTACDMLPDTVIRLAAIDNIIGIKEATGEIDRVAPIRAAAGQDFAIYSGDDATAIELILAGANGSISVTANVAPGPLAAAIHAAMEGQADAAHELDAKIAVLHSELFMESNPIPVKWALHEMGRITTGIRLPLTPLNPELRPRLRQALQATGLLS